MPQQSILSRDEWLPARRRRLIRERQLARQRDQCPSTFGHFLARCGATGADGEEHVSWLRATACLRKTGGEWAIVHEHLSAPFDPHSGKALLDLEPDHVQRASAA